MRSPKLTDTQGDVGEIPSHAVELKQQRSGHRSGGVRIGSEYGPVTWVEAPKVPFRWSEQDGVPVDEDPAVGCEHRVAGMRLAMGEDHSV
jgi:hypothetical protein